MNRKWLLLVCCFLAVLATPSVFAELEVQADVPAEAGEIVDIDLDGYVCYSYHNTGPNEIGISDVHPDAAGSVVIKDGNGWHRIKYDLHGNASC